MIRPPSGLVARAFGVADSIPLAVEGGQGVTFRLGDLALKPCENIEESEWLGCVLETVQEKGFRIARPIRAASGSFVVEGWSAMQWIEGTTAIEGRWHDAMKACEAFHRALTHIPWSPVLRRSDNPYVRADAAVWADTPLEGIYLGPTAERLRQLLRPVTLPSQLVHGDVGKGNLLFAQNQPPGIIDIAPYWHPAEYALAMLVADSIAWSDAPISLLADVMPRPAMDQMLARAVLFRLYVGFMCHGGETGAEQRSRAYAPVVEAIEQQRI